MDANFDARFGETFTEYPIMPAYDFPVAEGA
jgi:hypothetical protein